MGFFSEFMKITRRAIREGNAEGKRDFEEALRREREETEILSRQLEMRKLANEAKIPAPRIMNDDELFK